MQRHLAFLVGVLASATFGALVTGQGAGASERTLEAVQDCDEEMLAIFPVDTTVARSRVPSDYELRLAPDGSSLLGVAAKLCTWDVEGPRSAVPTEEVHVYINVRGPDQTIPVPGAPVTLPSDYWYNLFFDTEAPAWSRAVFRSYGGNVRDAEVEIEHFGPVRNGSVVEEGAGGQGYRWTEYTMPSPFFFGQHNFFFSDELPGRHLRAEAAQLFNMVGVGSIVMEIDPGSSLAEFGPVLLGQTFDFVPMVATVTLGVEDGR